MSQTITAIAPNLQYHQQWNAYVNDKGVYICSKDQEQLYLQNMGTATYSPKTQYYMDVAGNAYNQMGQYVGHMYEFNQFTTPTLKQEIGAMIQKSGQAKLAGGAAPSATLSMTGGTMAGIGGGAAATPTLGANNNATLSAQPAAAVATGTGQFTMAELQKMAGGDATVLGQLIIKLGVKPEAGVASAVGSAGVTIEDMLDLNSELNGGISKPTVTPGTANATLNANAATLSATNVSESQININTQSQSNEAAELKKKNEALMAELEAIRTGKLQKSSTPTATPKTAAIRRDPAASTPTYNNEAETPTKNTDTEKLEDVTLEGEIDLGKVEDEAIIALAHADGAKMIYRKVVTAFQATNVSDVKTLIKRETARPLWLRSSVLKDMGADTNIKNISDTEMEELLNRLSEKTEFINRRHINGTNIPMCDVKVKERYLLSRNMKLREEIRGMEMNTGKGLSEKSMLLQYIVKSTVIHEDIIKHGIIVKVLDSEVRITADAETKHIKIRRIA